MCMHGNQDHEYFNPFMGTYDVPVPSIRGLVTCDSIVDVFADGKHYMTHNNYKTMGDVDIPGYTKVLAIKVFIDDMKQIIPKSKHLENNAT